jgi:hypothetical protein
LKAVVFCFPISRLTATKMESIPMRGKTARNTFVQSESKVKVDLHCEEITNEEITDGIIKGLHDIQDGRFIHIKREDLKKGIAKRLKRGL